MSVSKRKPRTSKLALEVGSFSRREAAISIASGTRHIHSTSLGLQDPNVKISEQNIHGDTPIRYSWQDDSGKQSYTIYTSTNRSDLIDEIIKNSRSDMKRSLRERFSSVLEELISNSLFHAYRDGNGRDKYARHSDIELPPNEFVTLQVSMLPTGVWLSISDQGGNLKFQDLAKSLNRCYGNDATQIEEKEGGAGLGLYIIFETVSHIRIDVKPGKETVFSCWIADNGSADPYTFSFNFFVRK